MHAELPDAALLRRLERRLTGAKVGRQPIIGIDFVDHAPAVGILAQDELDELTARRKQGEPDRPVGSARQSGGISRKALEHQRGALGGAGGNPSERAAPAFGNDDRVPFIDETVGIGEIAGDLGPLAGGEVEPPDRARVASSP